MIEITSMISPNRRNGLDGYLASPSYGRAQWFLSYEAAEQYLAAWETERRAYYDMLHRELRDIE